MIRIEQLASTVSDNPLLQALISVVIALLLALIVDFLLARAVGPILRRTRYEIDDRILDLLRNPVFLTILFSGVGIALKLDRPREPFDFAATAAVKTLVVLVWLVFAGRLATLVLNWSAAHPVRFQFVQPASLPAFDLAAKILLFGLAVYLVLKTWRLDPTAWLTSAGIIGIVLGLAAKDTLANFFAGISILADAPYKVGDFIILDTDRGQVTKIGLRSTRILTRDDIEITVPNSTIANSKIINESGGPSTKHRVRVPVSVAYGSNLEQVRKVMEGAAADSSYIAKEPSPRVRFRSFGDSGVNVELLCWIEVPINRGLALDSLVTGIYNAFGANGIEIPYSKHDVYLKDSGQTATGKRGKREKSGVKTT